MKNPSGTFTNSVVGSWKCTDMNKAAAEGYLPESVCKIVKSSFQKSCGCAGGGGTAGAIMLTPPASPSAPAKTPAKAPTKKTRLGGGRGGGGGGAGLRRRRRRRGG
jgi:hypothetical protein